MNAIFIVYGQEVFVPPTVAFDPHLKRSHPDGRVKRCCGDCVSDGGEYLSMEDEDSLFYLIR